MRPFTLAEKKIIKQLAGASNPEDFALIRYIDENMEIRALEWDYEYKTLILILDDIKEGFSKFNQLCEILFLLKYLEDNRFINLYGFNTNLDCKVYNRRKYKYMEGNYYLQRENGTVAGFLDSKFISYSDLGKLLERYSYSLFYVSEALRALVQNDFKTEEQIQFEKNYELSKKSLRLAYLIGIATLIIGLISIILTIL